MRGMRTGARARRWLKRVGSTSDSVTGAGEVQPRTVPGNTCGVAPAVAGHSVPASDANPQEARRDAVSMIAGFKPKDADNSLSLSRLRTTVLLAATA